MTLRPLGPTLALAAIAAPALAQPFDYDFSGTLGDHFDLFVDQSEIASGQSGGVLAFDTGGLTYLGDYIVEAYLHASFTPRYDESWTASIDLTLPLAIDSAFTPDDSLEQGVEVGIVALNTNGTDIFNTFVMSVETYHGNTGGNPLERNYLAAVEVASGDLPGDTAPATGVEAATLTLTYNAATHVLTGSNGVGETFAANLGAGPTDFGMSDSDNFFVGLFLSVANRGIPAGTPATLDNFFAGFIPDPCVADINADGFLDQGDIQAFIALFLEANLAVDFNADGFIDQGDIQGFIEAFLAGC